MKLKTIISNLINIKSDIVDFVLNDMNLTQGLEYIISKLKELQDCCKKNSDDILIHKSRLDGIDILNKAQSDVLVRYGDTIEVIEDKLIDIDQTLIDYGDNITVLQNESTVYKTRLDDIDQTLIDYGDNITVLQNESTVYKTRLDGIDQTLIDYGDNITVLQNESTVYKTRLDEHDIIINETVEKLINIDDNVINTIDDRISSIIFEQKDLVFRSSILKVQLINLE